MKKAYKILTISVFLFFTITLMVGIAGWYVFFSPNTTVMEDAGVLYINRHSTWEEVLDSLRNKGYIKDYKSLSFVANLKKYPAHIKSGRYLIRNGIGNNQLINELRSGVQMPVRFTFNSVRTMEQFADIAANDFEFSAENFLEMVNDSILLDSLGFTRKNIIGMFIPNTYNIYWNIDIDKFIRRMKREYDRFWSEERLKKAKEIGLSPQEIITLASIVEEESSKIDEFPVIAGVYINRIKRGMKLDADPTLKFAAGDFSLKRVLNTHKEIDSPYNTYIYVGLPPGPIRMASIQAIEGVLNYQKHNYLYFCAKSDFSGYHNFSRTLNQHNRYAKEYQQALNYRSIWK